MEQAGIHRNARHVRTLSRPSVHRQSPTPQLWRKARTLRPSRNHSRLYPLLAVPQSCGGDPPGKTSTVVLLDKSLPTIQSSRGHENSRYPGGGGTTAADVSVATASIAMSSSFIIDASLSPSRTMSGRCTGAGPSTVTSEANETLRDLGNSRVDAPPGKHFDLTQGHPRCGN